MEQVLANLRGALNAAQAERDYYAAESAKDSNNATAKTMHTFYQGRAAATRDIIAMIAQTLQED